MMKKLLPLALIAVACEAMAQDAQCVRERAAMVENIQAYARSDLSLLGPHGISESVLEAVRQTERHRFIPGRSCSVAYMDESTKGSWTSGCSLMPRVPTACRSCSSRCATSTIGGG